MFSYTENRKKQGCIPVGCVPPACCPYLPACTAGGGTWSGGVPGPGGGVPGLGGYLVSGGVPGPGGTWSWGVYLVLVGVPGPGGCTCPGTPPVTRMTDRCKNITLPQTSFAGGNYTTIHTGLSAVNTFIYLPLATELFSVVSVCHSVCLQEGGVPM